MSPRIRSLFPLVALLVGISALAWAVSFGTLPPADFTFNNDDEVRTVDPATATGQPEHRIIDAIFEGLLRQMPVEGAQPDSDGLYPLEAAPGCAESYEVSPDGRTYTFHMRPTARWSNGDPLTAADFAWSWRRTLHPETAAEYAYQLHYIVGARQYTFAELADGDHVEIEMPDRPDRIQLFPRGTILRGILREIHRPPAPQLDEKATKDQRSKADVAWRKTWVYEIEVLATGDDVAVDWNKTGERRQFATDVEHATGAVEHCLQVLPDFASTVGIEVRDPATLVVRLNNPTPFFPELLGFYPYYPVHRGCVETYGWPDWTKSTHIISNGPFTLKERRIRDRIRLSKNPHYWNADKVQLNTIDALAVKYQTTALNMYLNGQCDWIVKPPGSMIAELKKRGDFVSAPAMITYFYRLNVARKPLDDVRVRRALNLAMNKQAICEHVTKAGERPATNLVPPGMRGYLPAKGPDHDIEEARRLLAEAGYPGGRGFPKMQILFNTHDAHRDIAEVIQQQWKTNLGIDIELRNLEWGVYLSSVSKIDFDIARAGWVPDYPDPNTFLDMFVTDGGHNNTNWSNKQYDHLIDTAAAEPDPAKRLKVLHDAERILMDEQPIIPIYFYVTTNMVHPRVRNFFPNAQDLHPLHMLQVEAPASRPRPESARHE